MLRIVGRASPLRVQVRQCEYELRSYEYECQAASLYKKNSNTNLASKAKNSDKLIKALVVPIKGMAATFLQRQNEKIERHIP